MPSAAAGDDARAVGRERDASRPSRCGPRRAAPRLAAGERPTAAPCRRTGAGDDARAVGRERDAIDPVGVALERLAPGWPLAASHSRTVPSAPAPETMRVPSGENATLSTRPSCPSNGSPRLPSGVPQPHRAVARRWTDARAVGRERDASDPAVVALERLRRRLAVAASHSRTVPSRRRRRCACRRARTRR